MCKSDIPKHFNFMKKVLVTMKETFKPISVLQKSITRWEIFRPRKRIYSLCFLVINSKTLMKQ